MDFLIWFGSIFVWLYIGVRGYSNSTYGRVWNNHIKYGVLLPYKDSKEYWKECEEWLELIKWRQEQIVIIEWDMINPVPGFFPPRCFGAPEEDFEDMWASTVAPILNGDARCTFDENRARAELPPPSVPGEFFEIGPWRFVTVEDRGGLRWVTTTNCHGDRFIKFIDRTWGLPEIKHAVCLDLPGDPCNKLMHYVKDGNAVLIRNPKRMHEFPFNGYTNNEYLAHIIEEQIIHRQECKRDFINVWTKGDNDAIAESD